METQTPIQNQPPIIVPPPVKPTGVLIYQPHHHISRWVALAIVFLAVAAVGYWAWVKSHSTFCCLPDKSYAPTVQDPIADWKIYRNHKYGFEIKYPTDWQYRYIEAYKNGENYIFELKEHRNDNYIVIAPTTGYAADPGPGAEISSMELSGVNATKYVLPKLTRIALENPPKNWIPNIAHIYFYIEDSKTVDQILSTFKFIEPEDLSSKFDLKNKVAGTKLYYSEKLGIGFTYDDGIGDTLKVSEIGDKIYLHGINQEAVGGNSIEVFSKDPGKSITEAIEDRFLQGYNPEDCYATAEDAPSEFNLPPGYIFSSISYPAPDDPEAPWFENSSKCPPNYSEINAAQYFLFNANVPIKYLFLKTGQDSMASDGRPITEKGGYSWSTSIRIIK